VELPTERFKVKLPIRKPFFDGGKKLDDERKARGSFGNYSNSRDEMSNLRYLNETVGLRERRYFPFAF